MSRVRSLLGGLRGRRVASAVLAVVVVGVPVVVAVVAGEGNASSVVDLRGVVRGWRRRRWVW